MKSISMEIALDPTKAFEYGEENELYWKKKSARERGFKKFEVMIVEPHKSFLREINTNYSGWEYQNISSKNITSTIYVSEPQYPIGWSRDRKQEAPILLAELLEFLEEGPEEYAKYKGYEEGKLHEEVFLHKKDINRAVIAAPAALNEIYWKILIGYNSGSKGANKSYSIIIYPHYKLFLPFS